MPYSIEVRKVSDASLLVPTTWRRHHFVFRRVWDLDVRVPHEEAALFAMDHGHTGEWESIGKLSRDDLAKLRDLIDRILADG